MNNKTVKIQRQTHTFDASEESMGRLATRIAILLRGKHRPSYAPNVDAGDFVVVDNIKKLKLTGKKLEQKVYHRYTNYKLKSKKMSIIFQETPDRLLRDAVYHMLPKNKLRDIFIKRLEIK